METIYDQSVDVYEILDDDKEKFIKSYSSVCEVAEELDMYPEEVIEHCNGEREYYPYNLKLEWTEDN
jgi:hypothetical protein